MTTKLALGIDPGSHNLGVAIACMDSGSPVAVRGGFRTLEPYDPTMTKTASHDLPLGKRLKSLGRALQRFLEQEVSALLGSDDWYLVFISIEDPSSATFSRKKVGANGKAQHDSFKTQLILGRSMQEAVHVCDNYADAFIRLNPTILREIPIVEVEPAESSTSVGCARNASKLDRNIAVCKEVGGYFDVPLNKNGDSKPESGKCSGGLLNGAGPDALDAYAALVAGAGKIKMARLEQAASNQAGQRSNVRVSNTPPNPKRRGGRPGAAARRNTTSVNG
jgi:hypothetical protein